MPTELLHRELTGEILDVYHFVFNKLSAKNPEFLFERAMMAVLRHRGIDCVQQDQYEIRYKGRIVGMQRLDIFVAREVVVELKVSSTILPIHLAQMISYMKTVEKQVGLLLRFGGVKPDFARRVFTTKKPDNLLAPEKSFPVAASDLLHPALIYQIWGGLLEIHNTLGPGFIHRIYANATFFELKLRGLDVKAHSEMRVFLDDFDLGTVKFQHVQIDQRVLVFPVAISDINLIRIENLKTWMRFLNIPLGILVNFDDVSLKPIILRT